MKKIRTAMLIAASLSGLILAGCGEAPAPDLSTVTASPSPSTSARPTGPMPATFDTYEHQACAILRDTGRLTANYGRDKGVGTHAMDLYQLWNGTSVDDPNEKVVDKEINDWCFSQGVLMPGYSAPDLSTVTVPARPTAPMPTAFDSYEHQACSILRSEGELTSSNTDHGNGTHTMALYQNAKVVDKEINDWCFSQGVLMPGYGS